MKWLIIASTLVLSSCAIVHEVIISEGYIIGWSNNGSNLSNGKWYLSFDFNNTLDLSSKEISLGGGLRSTPRLNDSDFLVVLSINKTGGSSLAFGKPKLQLKDSTLETKLLKIGELNKFGECNGIYNYDFKSNLVIKEPTITSYQGQLCLLMYFDILPLDPREEFSLEIPYFENFVLQSFSVSFKPKKKTFIYR